MQYFLCDCWLQTCQTSCFYHQPGVLNAFWGHFPGLFLNLTLNAQKRKKSHDNIFHFVYVVLGCKFAKCHVFFLEWEHFQGVKCFFKNYNRNIGTCRVKL